MKADAAVTVDKLNWMGAEKLAMKGPIKQSLDLPERKLEEGHVLGGRKMISKILSVLNLRF